MNLADVREKLMIFLLPIGIVVVVLWGLVALIGQTYFWDVSRLTVQIPGDIPQEVELEIQARLIYFDADFFGFYYPVHITLPYTVTQMCARECVFDRLPPGDGVLKFSEDAPERTRVFIAPDTQGVLNLRPAFSTTPLDASRAEALRRPFVSWEVQKLPWTIEKIHAIQGLVVTFSKKQLFLYDALTKQSLLLPVNDIPLHIARAEAEGQYFLDMNTTVFLWDRYGRAPLQSLTSTVFRGYTFSWLRAGSTSITQSDGEVILLGFWTPLYSEEGILVTDGREIREIRP